MKLWQKAVENEKSALIYSLLCILIIHQYLNYKNGLEKLILKSVADFQRLETINNSQS